MRATVTGAVLLGAMLAVAVPTAGTPPADLACDQAPGTRFYWVERAFCDLDVLGPDQAQGIVIWNHGISGTVEAYRSPAPLAFRLLQRRGWDVIAIKRHNLSETDLSTSLYRSVQRTLEEARAQRKLGYRKIALAGQSFGGYITLEAADTVPDFFAAIAMAPGVRAQGGSGRLDPSVTDRILQRVRADRLALVFPSDDALFGNLVRGPSAERILTGRRVPYLLLDETSGLTGHGGGVGGRFAFRYGPCLAEFLSAASVPAGRFTCPSNGDDWTVVRELLAPKATAKQKVVRDPEALPPAIRSLTGQWYGLMDDTVILFALVESGTSELRAMYRWASSRLGGGLYDAALKDGQVTVTFPSKVTVAITPAGEESSLRWTSADGSRVLTTKLLRATDDP